MAALSQQELQSKIHSLKRAPPPKAPVGAAKPSNPIQTEGGVFVFPKLKPTGKRQSLIEADSPATLGNENDLQATLRNRRALFEHNNVKPDTKPKPKFGRKLSEEEKATQDKEAVRDGNENIVNGIAKPKLKPLPTLHSLGAPPRKPARALTLISALDKYKDCRVIIAPRTKSTLLVSESDVHNSGTGSDQDEEMYDDTKEGPEDSAVQEQGTREDEPIQEEMYDDVDELAEQVKAGLALEEMKGQETSEAPIDDEFYDDLNTFVQSETPGPLANSLTIPADDTEQFGEDLYQPVDSMATDERLHVQEADEEGVDYELLPNEQPPPLPAGERPSSQQSPVPEDENKKKEKKEKEKRERELQKKKEKDEQKRKKEEEKREREEKKRKEEEKKRREKVDKELKKTHKLKGNDPNVGVGTAKEEFKGTGKQELPCCKGTSLCIITKEGCPDGKWLVRSTDGHFGYVPSSIIHVQVSSEDPSDAIDEDLYECVDTYQDQAAESSPPPPPSPRIPQDHNEEEQVYDDAIEDEEIYDDVG